LWCSQALYARAFYASGNTLTPMIASTVIVWRRCHVRAAFPDAVGHRTGPSPRHRHRRECAGDPGLLHLRGMVPLGGLNWKELGKCALVGAVSGGLSYEVMRGIHSRWQPPR